MGDSPPPGTSTLPELVTTRNRVRPSGGGARTPSPDSDRRAGDLRGDWNFSSTTLATSSRSRWAGHGRTIGGGHRGLRAAGRRSRGDEDAGRWPGRRRPVQGGLPNVLAVPRDLGLAFLASALDEARFDSRRRSVCTLLGVAPVGGEAQHIRNRLGGPRGPWRQSGRAVRMPRKPGWLMREVSRR